MAATHISIADLPHLADTLDDRLRSGEEIILDSGSRPIALLAPLPGPKSRTVSEIIAALEAREQERGYPIRMGPEFADDLEKIIENRRPSDTSAWD